MPCVFRVYRFLGAVHDVIVDAVLDIRSAILDSKQPMGVGFVLGEQTTLEIPRNAASDCRADRDSARSPGWARDAPHAARAAGFESPQDQVLRNQTVGSRRMLAASGPRFATVILIRMSSVSALAYSTNTSK